MPDCVIKIDGVDYVPVRAIPAVTANRFDPLAATQLLGGDEPLVFARSYYVEPFGLVPPPAWHAPKDAQRLLRQEGASYIDMIKALPARIVVPLDDLAKALFDAFIEPNLTWTAPEDLLLSNPGFLKGPIPQPIMEGFIYDLVMEGFQSATITVLGEHAEPTTNEEAKPAPIQISDEQADTPADGDHDEVLAALFDPVPVEALEKMFPADGKWEDWKERADRNGLIDARQERARFNPYKAGLWFVRKGAEGWDDSRLYRTLASNLPARSFDNKHLLTGSVE